MTGPSTAFGGPPPRASSGRNFGEAAERLAGAAALLLGWHPDGFWNATPQELATALSLFAGEVEGPDPEAIVALKLRFPDED